MMGSALNLRHISDSSYSQTIAREYDIVTAENACKWGPIRPNKWTYNLDDCVNHLKYAIAHDQKFRGHNLVWGVWNPDWLTNFSGNASELEEIMKQNQQKKLQNHIGITKEEIVLNKKLVQSMLTNELTGNAGSASPISLEATRNRNFIQGSPVTLRQNGAGNTVYDMFNTSQMSSGAVTHQKLDNIERILPMVNRK